MSFGVGIEPSQRVRSIIYHFGLDTLFNYRTQRFAAHSTNAHELRRNAARCRKGVEGGVDGQVFQTVRCRLKRRLAHLVHAERMPEIFTSHKSVACDISGRTVHCPGMTLN